jgi:hypothetical protein
MENYYIETSARRIYFISENVKNIKLINDRFRTSDNMYIINNCKFRNDEDMEDLSSIFCSWSKMKVKETNNGLFLYTEDNYGPAYGEYKIFSE